MINRGLFRGEASFIASEEGRSVSINVGLCGILLLPEALKGEVVTVGVALSSISNSFSFSGVSKR